MERKIQTFTEMKPTWAVAGEWVVAESEILTPQRFDVPAFVIWANAAYESLSKSGADELPRGMVDWIRQGMNRPPNVEQINTFTHPVFSKLFPISTLPQNITPNWAPWRVVETPLPKTTIVVQPLTLTPIAVPKVMERNLVTAKVVPPPKIDPYVMGEIREGDAEATLPRAEANQLRVVISTFWNNLVRAEASLKVAREIAGSFSQPRTTTTRTELINSYGAVVGEASANLDLLAKRVGLYLKSQRQDFPLSITSRGIIQLPWIIKAAEAWLEPIKLLAEPARIELPQG